MPKVYVTNFSGYTYDNASVFGEEIIYITNGYVDFKKIEEVTAKVKSFINQATPNDYLLLSGNNLLCCIASHYWLMRHGLCKILHYNKFQDSYVEYELKNES